MHKEATINVRIDSPLKLRAETILHRIGLTSAEAVRLFYAQIYLHKGLPFEVKIPNETTVEAMRDADTGKTIKAKNVDDIFNGID